MPNYTNFIKTITTAYAKENDIKDESNAFEKMTTDLILKNYNLSPDDLDDGNVDGRLDGGIDGFYIFVNDRYIKNDEDFEPETIQKYPKIELYLIQNKFTNHFDETPILKLHNTTERLLDEQDELGGIAEHIKEKCNLFHAVWNQLLTKMPTVSLSLIYVANAGNKTHYPSVIRLAENKQKHLQERYQNSFKINIQLIDSLDIYKLHQSRTSYSKELVFEDVISTDSAYVITTTLEEYFKFITEDPEQNSPNGDRTVISDHLFDDNVRHYQGEVTVNKEISETLRDNNSGEFWWLNNGITIICTDARIKSKKIHLEDIQIVNGLQTSYCIFNTKIAYPTEVDYSNRSILIRIIETEDTSAADRIIKATNSQNPMNSWSLHATDPIQRLIEERFKQEDLYYDRRKGYHKNNKKPISKIVSINYVGQCMIAMGLSQPDTARARPGTFLKVQEQYNQVFNDNLDLDLFYTVTTLQKQVEATIRANPDFKAYYTDIRFHVSAFICAYLAKRRVTDPALLIPLIPTMSSISEELITSAIEKTVLLLTERSDSSDLDLARVAKSKEFREDVINAAIQEGRSEQKRL